MNLNLSDNEKRDVIKLIESGKPLPDKYRFLLFGDDREVELIWNGKTSEVENSVLPFQTIEHIDEPRSEDKKETQDSLFDTSGRQIAGWTNKLIWGDNKLILSSLKNGPLRKEIEAQGGLKLIYIDPPFDVGADFSMQVEIGDEEFTKKPSVIEEVAYRDTWGKGTDSFISMIYERFRLMHDLLSDDGSIFVHCDWRVSGNIRLVLDEIFGSSNFVNEIIWTYFGPGTDKAKEFTKKHDTIFYYAKNKGKHKFNDAEIRTAHSEKTKGNYKKGLKGSGFGAETINDKQKEVYTDDTNLNKLGKIPEDWWEMAIAARYPVDGVKRMGYPTEKPWPLIERIIKTGTEEGDLIADFFCGSGVSAAVSEMNNRKWICSDLGRFGIHTTRKRIINIQRELKDKGKDFRAFEILNLGTYERDAFVKVDGDLKKEQKLKIEDKKQKDFIKLILQAYKAESVDSFEHFVGKKRDRVIAVGPLTDPVSVQFIYDACHEAKENGITKIDILGFEFGMGIDINVLINEDVCRGVDISLKIIPGEVFDKRAIERGHVKFYDLAYVDFRSQIIGRGKECELKVELTDFAVFYNQDDVDIVGQKMRQGSTKVVLENGQVIKLSKAKGSDVIEREVLTKEWTDWIDYWSVDFDFESKKEIVRVEENDEEVEKWTGNYIFENEWQSFRTKKDRSLELTSASVPASKGEKRKVAVKVIDIFGNDTTKVIEINI